MGLILPPFLFNVHMDELSVMLNEQNIGCITNIRGKLVNYLMYADNLVLIAPIKWRHTTARRFL